jgi:thiamine pyrophosphokinase
MFRCDVFPMSAIFVRSSPAYVHLFDCYIFVNPAPVDAGSSLKYIDSGDNIMKKCIIAGAGDFGVVPLEREKNDILIAADAGLEHLKRYGEKPDVIIGDFDSLGYVPDGNVIKAEKRKDDTDMMLCIRYGLNAGYRSFFIYGATGGRTSHTLANIQSLVFLREHGARGIICSKDENFTVISGGDRISFKSGASGELSLFALGDECSGVTEKGLSYELSDAVVKNSFPLCVSNSFTGDAAGISIGKGTALVVFGCGLDFIDFTL